MQLYLPGLKFCICQKHNSVFVKTQFCICDNCAAASYLYQQLASLYSFTFSSTLSENDQNDNLKTCLKVKVIFSGRFRRLDESNVFLSQCFQSYIPRMKERKTDFCQWCLFCVIAKKAKTFVHIYKHYFTFTTKFEAALN